jgi:hypothetical protein
VATGLVGRLVTLERADEAGDEGSGRDILRARRVMVDLYSS